MRTYTRGIVGCILALGLLLYAAPVSAQTWTNVTVTGAWEDAGNWSPNQVPGDAATAYLTNRVATYAVDYNTGDNAFKNSARLIMINTAPNTVTLNVNANMTPSATMASATSRFFLEMNAQSIIQIAENHFLRATADQDLRGQIDVRGELGIYWPAVVSPRYMYGTWTVRDGGTLETGGTGAYHIRTHGGGNVLVESGGKWLNTGRGTSLMNTTLGFVAVTVQGDFEHSGTSSGIFVSSDNQTVNYVEMHVKGNGRVLLSSGTSAIVVAVAGNGHGCGRLYLADNGSVTNKGQLRIAQMTHATNTRNCRGQIHITGGRWVNPDGAKMVLVGGYDPFSATDFTGAPVGNRTSLDGWIAQTAGVCDIRGDIYVANGPASGTIRVRGGDFYNTNATGTATMRVGSMEGHVILAGNGTLEMTNGTVTVDNLVANQGTTRSRILLTGGALTLGACDINTGSALTVGNGTNAAALNLRTGTHTFAHGFVVSSNATLAAGGPAAVGHAIVTGDVTLQSGSKLHVNVASAASADLWAVTGSVTLGGTLDVTELGAYDPAGGATWDILTATDGIAGTIVSSDPRTYKVSLSGDSKTLILTRNPEGTLILLR